MTKQNNERLSGAEFPHDLLAEKSLIGCLLVDNKSFDDVTDLNIVADDFYHVHYGIIFQAIKDQYILGMPYDIVTVSSRLADTGKLERIGGNTALYTICEEVGSPANIFEYAKIVKEKATLREVMRTASHIYSASASFATDLKSFLEEVESSFFKLTSQNKNNRLIPIKDSLFENLKELERPARAPGEIVGITTGLQSLDKVLLGLQPGQLMVIAARPGVGKTALALNMAVAAAKQTQLPVAIFSYEMSHVELSMRVLATESAVDSRKMKTKSFTETDLRSIGKAVATVSNLPLYVSDVGGNTLFDIRSYCRKLKAQQGLGMIVIDYLQLMPPATKKQSREQEIAELSRGLKMLAGELKVPVIALSQLNRASEARTGKKPQLSDLRESGSIEQDANIVCLMYRKDEEKKGVVTVDVAKNRNGEPGDVDLSWIGNIFKFGDMEHR